MSEPRTGRTALLLILLLGTVLRLIRLGSLSLWFDEGLSVVYTDSLVNLLPGSERGTDSPLFLTVLYIWKQFGSSLFWIRLVPAGFGVGTIWASFLLIRKLFGPRIGLAVSFMVAIAPIHIYYSQELRTYSLLAFIATMATYLMVRVLHDGGRANWFGFALFCILGIYTHYVIGILYLVFNAYALLRIRTFRHRIVPWVVCHLAMGVSFIPWIAHFARQFAYQTDTTKQGGWVHGIDGYKLISALTDFTFGFHIQDSTVVVLIGLLCMVLCLYALFSITISTHRYRSEATSWLVKFSIPGTHKPERLLVGFLFFGVPGLIIAIGFSPIGLQLFVTRYFIYVSIPFYTLLALGIARLPRTVIRGAVIGVLLVVSTVGTVRMYENVDLYDWIGLYSKKPYHKVFETIQEQWQPGDIVLHHQENSLIPFEAFKRLQRIDDPDNRYNRLLVTAGRVRHKLEGEWYPGYENAPNRFVMDHDTKQLLVCWNMTEPEIAVALAWRQLNPDERARVLRLAGRSRDAWATVLEETTIPFSLLKTAVVLRSIPQDRWAAITQKLEPFTDYQRIWYVAGYWQARDDYIFTGRTDKAEKVDDDFVGEALHWFGVINEFDQPLEIRYRNMTLVKNFTTDNPARYEGVTFQLYERPPTPAMEPE